MQQQQKKLKRVQTISKHKQIQKNTKKTTSFFFSKVLYCLFKAEISSDSQEDPFKIPHTPQVPPKHPPKIPPNTTQNTQTKQIKTI